ncbi:MAG TPA: hypothetical protein VI585_09680 [Candidatus Binatia bacterium]
MVLLYAPCSCSCSPAEAQQTGKVARIAYLDPSTESAVADFLDAFRKELSKLGWIEGNNLSIEYRFAERVELIKEAFPSIQRVGVLFNPDNSINDRNLPAMEQTSKSLNLGMQKFAVRSPTISKTLIQRCQNYVSTQSRCQKTIF